MIFVKPVIIGSIAFVESCVICRDEQDDDMKSLSYPCKRVIAGGKGIRQPA